MEDDNEKAVLLSPDAIFFDSLEKACSVSATSQSDVTSTPIRNKSAKSSNVETTCKKMASKIVRVQLPLRKSASSAYQNVVNTKKVWTASLDEELIRCWNKYKAFKSCHPDPSVFKYSTRNKILSRMLLSRTSVLRTPKQVSARLQRIIKEMQTPRASPYPCIASLATLYDTQDQFRPTLLRR